MALDRLTKVDGGGISTTSDYRVGIITATKFVGPIEGDVTGSITATEGTFSGNVTIGGTLTYEDVTNIDSVGIITARDGIHVGAGVSVVGIVTAATFKGDGDFFDIDVDGHTNLDNVSVAGVTTFASNVHLGDNDKLIIGDHGDIQIYNDGTKSVIENGGNSLGGNNNSLHIYSLNDILTNSTYSQYFHCGAANKNSTSPIQLALIRNAGVKAYYNNNLKLETSPNGVDITGGLTVSGIATFTGAIDANGDLDVDGHTNLDNVSIAGVTTFASAINGSGQFVWDAADADVIIRDSTDSPQNWLWRDHSASKLYLGTTSNVVELRSNLLTNADSTYDIGTNSVRWRNLYADTLYGDGSNLTGITQTTINSNVNNYLITGTGTANTLQGESRLTFDGNSLDITGSGSHPFSVGGGDYRNLVISGNSQSSSGFIYLGNGAATNNADFDLGRIRIYNGPTQVAQIAGSTDTSANDDGRLVFATRNTGGSLQEKVRITSSGRLGLNTDNPDTTFTIKSGGDAQMSLKNSSGTTKAYLGTDGVFGSASTDDLRIRSDSSNIIFGFSGTERLRITSDGNVLIGSFTPVDTRNTGGLHIQDNRGISFRAYGSVAASRNWRIRNDDSAWGNLDFSVGDNNTTDIGSGAEDTVLSLTSSHKVGIDQTSPQAKLHIGNYETTQNINQSSVTQYFIDSTRSLKIARCNRGSITSAGWYDVAVISMSGFSYRCQVSLGGDFTQDVLDIEVQTAYASALNNKYSLQLSAKSASAHNNDRMQKVKVVERSGTFYIQVYITGGVNSNTNGKSVLETTCGIYAQNVADNSYPMFAAKAASGYNTITRTFPDFGVHAAWDFTCNSSGVRSYTPWTGGGNEFIVAENAGNGTSQGTVGRFIAPMKGLYQVNFNVKQINPTIDNNVLISMYGSMTYDAQNPWSTNAEVYDPRGAATGAQGQQGEGNSWWLRMAKDDYFSFDYYRPGGGNGYIDGGGQLFGISVFKVGSP